MQSFEILSYPSHLMCVRCLAEGILCILKYLSPLKSSSSRVQIALVTLFQQAQTAGIRDTHRKKMLHKITAVNLRLQKQRWKSKMKRESSSSSCPFHRIKQFYQNSFPLQLESSQQTMFAVFTNPETEESWKKVRTRNDKVSN